MDRADMNQPTPRAEIAPFHLAKSRADARRLEVAHLLDHLTCLADFLDARDALLRDLSKHLERGDVDDFGWEDLVDLWAQHGLDVSTQAIASVHHLSREVLGLDPV
jgi:hypothetical protein